MTKLTPEVLLAHGFELVERERLSEIKEVYSLKNIVSKFGEYPFSIDVTLDDYPETNANSGVIYLYMDGFDAVTVPEDLIEKDEWTPEDHKRAAENATHFEETIQPIAWHVVTLERLNDIVKSVALISLPNYQEETEEEN